MPTIEVEGLRDVILRFFEGLSQYVTDGSIVVKDGVTITLPKELLLEPYIEGEDLVIELSPGLRVSADAGAWICKGTFTGRIDECRLTPSEAHFAIQGLPDVTIRFLE
jgi:hypothetical protein